VTSVGKGDFPEMTITEAIEVVEGIKREKAQTTAGLGKVMGLTNVTTGFFYNKVAALSKYYGLIERDKTSIALTPLAKRIVFPISSVDREAAIHEVAKRVPLLRDLFQMLGPDYHDLDFAPKLLSLTQASHDELEAKAPRVERLYRDALQYLRGGATLAQSKAHAPGPSPGADLQEGDPGGQSRPGEVPPVLATDAAEYLIFQLGSTFVRVKHDQKTLKTVRKVIDAWAAPDDSEASKAA
jgi:hypothetical protein